jgi:tetratricopeptide (TPR) repeat protein
VVIGSSKVGLAIVAVVTVMLSAGVPVVAQVTIQGTVHTSAGKPVENASVRAEQQGAPAIETRTDAAGVFTLSAPSAAGYTLSAEKSGWHSRPTTISPASQGTPNHVDLILESEKDTNTVTDAAAMQFADNPNFTVAGVTDWTAVGGHGSDSTLRTSEDLARETLALKAQGSATSASTAPTSPEAESKLRTALAGSPGSFAANHQLGAFYLHGDRFQEAIPLLQAAYQIDPSNTGNEYDLALACEQAGNYAQARGHVQTLLTHKEDADLHRLLGELDEKMGDPLAAVHEDEQAVRLDPNEQNYFAWGSELLLHRAVWQAAEVFKNGTRAHPGSARMLTALGTALFAGDLYDEAAASLCAASDLAPTDMEPYRFMGRVEMASPKPLACVEVRLARFVRQQPGNADAHYLYAMAILKRQPQPADPQAWQQVVSLLNRAVALDTRCAEAYLQLGILFSSQSDLGKAIGYYNKAIAADPQSGEAHYRLGVAYDRAGTPEKARQEFQLHDEIERLQAATVERQRREVKQFLVVLQGQPASPSPH